MKEQIEKHSENINKLIELVNVIENKLAYISKFEIALKRLAPKPKDYFGT